MSMEPVFELVDAVVDAPDGRVLGPLTWSVPTAQVTALMGPAGGGKSTLLRILSGATLPAGWSIGGRWRHRGRELGSTSPTFDVALVRQNKRGPVDFDPKRAVDSGRWREGFCAGTRTVLLDEPSRGVPPQDVEEMKAMLAALTRAGGEAIVVTHDLKFAREVADRVCLVIDKRIEVECDAETFFRAPPTELAERFVTHGTCWPASRPEPTLPEHFHWVIPQRLAGMGAPGLLRDVHEDLAAISSAGIAHLVTLTEEPLSRELLRPYGIGVRHHPIRDMGVPAIGTTASVLREVQHEIEAGKGVAFHCRAGLGRTGTMLASYLVWTGTGPRAALAAVRAIRAGYVQSRAQEQFVHRFAEAMGLDREATS
jgi:atypical dual specificity phosphatase